MKNMKKILSALTAFSFASVAGMSVVACGPQDDGTATSMNPEILKELGITNDAGESLVEVSIDSGKFKVSGIENIDATKLLEDGKAKSEAIEKFLKNTLKLEANEEGKFENAAHAKLSVIEEKINPVIVPKEDNTDFQIQGGTVSVQWKNDESEEPLSTDSVNLSKEAKDLNLVTVLPTLSEVNDLDNTVGPLKNFKVGLPSDGIKTGDSILDSIKKDGTGIKTLAELSKLTGVSYDIVINITKEDDESASFGANDTAKVSIKFGSVNIQDKGNITISPADPEEK